MNTKFVFAIKGKVCAEGRDHICMLLPLSENNWFTWLQPCNNEKYSFILFWGGTKGSGRRME